MQSTKSAVGRKIVMAVTGLILLGFVLGHLAGNTTVFFGEAINAYAQHLRDLGPFLWLIRGFMLLVFALHIYIGIQLTLENKAAAGVPYQKKVNVRTTFSSETMIISGLVLLAFVVYHLLHFTFHVGVSESLVSGGHVTNVLGMVVEGLGKGVNVLVYVVAMFLLFFHLGHGVQSFLQTLGLSNDKSLPVVTKGGKALAFVVLLGYISIPLLVLAGVVK